MNFTTEQVLSVSTGRLCCDMGSLYEILEYLMGCRLTINMLPTAGDVAAPHIKSCLPWSDVDINRTNHMDVVAACNESYGVMHEIEPVPGAEEKYRALAGESRPVVWVAL